MIGALFLFLILFIVTQALHGSLEKKHPFFSGKLMNRLFFYHFFFFLVYYINALSSRSDSQAYYERTDLSESWFQHFGTSTTFIDFISWPFINILNFNYEMMMILYAWYGYIGFMYAYLFFRENIPIKIKVFDMDFLTLILFFPNMHYWTASLGKGAPIFMALMMFAYAIQKPKQRWGLLAFGAFLVYFIRPHVFLFMAAGTVLGYMTGKEKVPFGRKVLIYIGMIGTLIATQETILGMAGLNESENLVQGFENFTEDRAGELAKSSSGVDISSYPLPLKLFTFWFRPLFFDAPGILGLIVSTENLIYLLLFLKILKLDFLKFLKSSPISVKMSLTLFFLASFALSFVSSNLGIIIRQKSMVMYFLFFTIYYYLAQKKYNRIIRIRRLRKMREAEV